jgi:hypothetical protein
VIVVALVVAGFLAAFLLGMVLGAAVVVDGEHRNLRTLAARDRRLAEWAAVDRGRRIARDVLDQDGGL